MALIILPNSFFSSSSFSSLSPLSSLIGQVRSGQVRSECLTCTSRAICCSARLSRTQVPVPLSWIGKKRGGESKGGPPALVGTREYEQSDWNR